MKIPEFTPAEKAVVRLISLGLSTREVAHVLGKAESTVDNQRTSAMRSADITTATELVRVVLLAGVSTLEDELTPSERRKVNQIRRGAARTIKRPRRRPKSKRTAPKKKRSAKKKRFAPKRAAKKSAPVAWTTSTRKPTKKAPIRKRPGPTKKSSATKRSAKKKAGPTPVRTSRRPVKESPTVQPAPELATLGSSAASPEIPIEPLAEPDPTPTSS